MKDWINGLPVETAVDRNGEPLVPGDQVRFKAFPDVISFGTIIPARRRTTWKNDQEFRALAIREDSTGAVYYLMPRGTTRIARRSPVALGTPVAPAASAAGLDGG